MGAKVDLLRCTGCGICTFICPVGVLTVDMKCRVGEGCISCGKCVDFCHWRAITLEEEPRKRKKKAVIASPSPTAVGEAKQSHTSRKIQRVRLPRRPD